jgi:hypothetical protein
MVERRMRWQRFVERWLRVTPSVFIVTSMVSRYARRAVVISRLEVMLVKLALEPLNSSTNYAL